MADSRAATTELGVNPAKGPGAIRGTHEISFMCNDINPTVAELGVKGVEIEDEPKDLGFEVAATMTLPGGVKVPLYQPRHLFPIAAS